MEEADSVTIQKRQAAIKLAKNLEPFNYTLGEDFDAVYVETLTEDIKQLAREFKKLAKVVAVSDSALAVPGEDHAPLTVTVDGEEERVTKMMRRYSTRIMKMADLIYEVAYLDFAGLEQEELKGIMEVDDEGEDDE